MKILVANQPVVVLTQEILQSLQSLGEDPSVFNRVDWPAGASKWAVARFLITKEVSDALKALGRANQLTLELDTVVFDRMYQLPHRPVHLRVSGSEIKDALYELTLVDERYFWQYTSPFVQPDLELSQATWQDLLEEMLTQLGIHGDTQLSLDPQSAGAGTPWDFNNPWEPLSLQIDRVCAMLGLAFVARRASAPGEQRYLINVPSQFNDSASTFGPDSNAHAGGQIFSAADPDGQAWLNAIMPSQVFVVFPRISPGEVLDPPAEGAPSLQDDQFTVYSSTSGKPFGVSGRSGAVAVLHDSMYAVGKPGEETNGTELQARADYLARRYYNRFRIANSRAVYDDWREPGDFPGKVCWYQLPTGVFTRVEVDSQWDLYGGTSNVGDGLRHVRISGVGSTQVVKTYDGGLLIWGGGDREKFLASITGVAALDSSDSRWVYTISEVEIVVTASEGVPSSTSVSIVEGGRTGKAINLAEMLNQGTSGIAFGIDRNGTDYPDGVAPRPVSGAGTNNAHKLDVVVQILGSVVASDGSTVYFFDRMGTHDGTCQA